MKRFIALMTTVAVVSEMFHVVAKKPKFCCSPDQWETFQWGQGGASSPSKRGGVAVTTISSLSFDRNLQRFYYYTNITFGASKASTKTLEDFKTGIKYTLDVKTNKCVKSNITVSLDSGCVPDQAKPQFRNYYGVGNDILLFTAYRVLIKKPAVGLDDIIMISEKDCILVSESFMGMINGVEFAMSLDYFNTTLGIRDPSVFSIPEICNENATLGDTSHHLHSALYGFF